MNHVYRLVWNCAKRCLQVVSELAIGAGGTGAKRKTNSVHPLAHACAIALGTSVLLAALPVAAQSVGGRGGAGEAGGGGRGGETAQGGDCGTAPYCPSGTGYGANGYGGQGGGIAINPTLADPGLYAFGSPTIASPLAGEGGAPGNFTTGGGGVSAPGIYAVANTNITVNATVTGGAGGAGAFDGTGGGGGAGAAGIHFAPGGILNNTSTIAGGVGGAGFGWAYGGGGGGAGSAVMASDTVITNSGTLIGGTGGAGGAGAYNAGGGGGGHGLMGSGITLTNSGTIQGGAGGASGGAGAAAGTNGDALLLTGGSNTLNLQAGTSIIGDIETLAGSTLTVNVNAPVLAVQGGLINQGAVTWNTGANNSSLRSTAGAGTLTKTGTGTLSLLGASTRTGSTVVSQGTLQVGSSAAHGELAGAVDVAAGAKLTFSNADQYTRTGVISGAGSVVQNGTGTTVFASDNTYSGTTQIDAGTLQVGNGGAAGSLGGSMVTNNGSLVFNRSDTFTVINTLFGVGSLTKQGVGTMVYLGGGGRTGTTSVQAGTLQLGDGVTPGGAIGNGAVNINTGASLVYNTATFYQHDALLSGGGSVEKKGTSTLLLTGNNSFSGGLTLTGGTLGITSGAALGTGTFTHNGGALDTQGGTFTLSNNMVLGATGGLFRIFGGTLTLAGPVSGAGGLWSTGTGTLALAGPALNATGSYTFDTPVLLTANTALNTDSTVRFNNTLNGAYALTIDAGDNVSFNGVTGATLPLAGLSVNSGGGIALGNMTVAGNVSATAAGYVLSNGAVNFAGTTSLRSNGGDVTFTNAANEFAGTVNVVAAGNAELNDVNALTLGMLSTGGNLSATSHGVLNAGTGTIGGSLTLATNNGGLMQTGALSVSGSTTLNAGTGNVNLTNATNVFSGPVNITANNVGLAASSAVTLGTTNAGSLQVASPAGINILNSITTLGLQMYTGPVRVHSGVTFTSSALGGQLSFNGTLDGAYAVAVNGSGRTEFFGEVGGASALSSLTTDAGGTTYLGGNVTTTGAQTYNDNVQLTGNIGLTSTAGGNLAFAGTVSGANTLTTSTTASTAFGGAVSLNGLNVTSGTFSSGDLTIAGPLSIRTTAGAITQTSGAYTVAGPSNFNAGSSAISLTGHNSFNGIVNLTGGNTAITNLGNLNLGAVNTGNLTAVSLSGNISGQNAVVNGALNLSAQGGISQTGAWNVTGASAMTATGGDIILTNAGNDFVGAVSLTGGSIRVADANALSVASVNNATNSAVSLTAGGALNVGSLSIQTGTADLNLTSGDILTATGTLSGANVQVSAAGNTALNTVTASGTADLRSAGGTLDVGQISADVLTGSVAGRAFFGNGSNSVAKLGDFTAGEFWYAQVGPQALTIQGALSAGQIQLALYPGGGLLTGSLTSTDYTRLWSSTRLQVGNNNTQGNLGGNVVLDAASTLAFNRTDTVTYAGNVSGAGSLQQTGSGKLVLEGNNAAFTGSTSVNSGTLIVGGAAGSTAHLGGAVNVATGATLGGHGTLDGAVSLAGGAHLAPGNSIGTLTVGGNFTAAQGSVLDFEVGAPGADFQTPGLSDRLTVGGDLSLQGATLNVINTGAMGPGLYNLINYNGALTQSNGGLTLGTTPAGHTVSLQYLTADKKINLLDSTGVTLQFWNADGTANATQAGGGGGTWSRVSPVWADSTGALTSTMQPEPGFAIFGGTPGTVAVDGTSGAVRATGLQFVSDGYVLYGDDLTLITTPAGTPIIRVGDGSVSAAGMTATLNSNLISADGFRKTDAGTLLLNGNNTLGGTTYVSGGTLVVGNDNALGTSLVRVDNSDAALVVSSGVTLATAGVTLDGGTLDNTGGTLEALQPGATAVSIGNAAGTVNNTLGATVDAAGTAIHIVGDAYITNDAASTLRGGDYAIFGASGSVQLSQAGRVVGDVVLADAGTHSVTLAQGSTLAGALDMGSNGQTALTLTGTGTQRYSDAVTGTTHLAGVLQKDDAGTWILDADLDNRLTRVVAGTLQIGEGGTTGSIAGDLENNGTVQVFRSDDITFAGTLSGTGTLIKTGAGVLALEGNSSVYAGQTDVRNGTLLIGSSAGGTAALGGDITVRTDAAYGWVGTLGGHGTVGGDLQLNAGAHLSPGNSIGQFNVGGDFTAAQGSVLDFEVGAPGADFQTAGVSDRVTVGGNLDLQGATLNLTDVGGMGPGMYTLFSYGGTLTESNGGLVFGTTPSGHTLSLQRLTASKQINLLDTTGVALQFWNGDGSAAPGQLGGGSGTWTATSGNWSDASGSLEGVMVPQPGFAIFSGTPGTVTVDASGGAVSATGLQFASSGYTLAGNGLNLMPAPSGLSTVRVGDGSSAAASMSATISGVISGATGIDKTDAGTLILTANNTYAGNTQISGGTLQLGNGGTSGSVAGNITNNAALVLNRSDNVTYAGAMSGSGTFVKQGAGTLTLTGNSSAFSGNTTFSQGTVVLGAAAGSTAVLGGNVRVDTGVSFGGHGRVGGNLSNFGTVMPGNSPGTLTVSGYYVQATSGTLVIEALPDGTSDRLVVGGSASLAGRLQVLPQAGTWPVSNNYTILTAAGGVSGTFSNVTSSLAFLDPVVAYATNAVTLTLQRNDVAFTDVAETPNQVAAATGLDGLGIGNPVYTAFTRLTASGAVLALDQLSGEIHPDVRANMMDQSRFWRDGINNRLAVAHEDVGTHAWVTGFGGGGELEGNTNAADTRADAVGAMAGVDFAAGEHARVGVAVGTGESGIRLNARFSHARVNSTSFGVYGQADLGPVELGGTAWRTANRIETDRSVVFGGLMEGPSARYNGDTTGFSLKIGHRFEWAGGSFLPYVQAAHVRVGTDAFAETGGATALRGASEDDRRTLLTAGLRWSAHVGRGSAVVYGDAGWTHVTGNSAAPQSTLQFVSGNVPFAVAGVEGARDAFHLDTGIQWKLTPNLTMRAGVQARLGKDTRSEAAHLGLDWRF